MGVKPVGGVSPSWLFLSTDDLKAAVGVCVHMHTPHTHTAPLTHIPGFNASQAGHNPSSSFPTQEKYTRIQESENDAVCGSPLVCPGPGALQQTWWGTLGYSQCFEGNSTSFGHHANYELKVIHGFNIRLSYVPFDDISLQGWVFSCCCDKNQACNQRVMFNEGDRCLIPTFEKLWGVNRLHKPHY